MGEVFPTVDIVQFTSPNFTTSEDAHVTIDVQRIHKGPTPMGKPALYAMVRVAQHFPRTTSSALACADFLDTTVIASFNASTPNRIDTVSVTIPIVDDSVVEGANERFRATLTGCTGNCSVGDWSSTEIYVIDNDEILSDSMCQFEEFMVGPMDASETSSILDPDCRAAQGVRAQSALLWASSACLAIPIVILLYRVAARVMRRSKAQFRPWPNEVAGYYASIQKHYTPTHSRLAHYMSQSSMFLAIDWFLVLVCVCSCGIYGYVTRIHAYFTYHIRDPDTQMLRSIALYELAITGIIATNFIIRCVFFVLIIMRYSLYVYCFANSCHGCNIVIALLWPREREQSS